MFKSVATLIRNNSTSCLQRIHIGVFMYLVLIPTLISCTQAPDTHTYYVVTHTKQWDPISQKYYGRTETDTIQAVSDSAAYWEGVKERTAQMMTENFLRKEGIKNPHIRLVGVEVKNEMYGDVRVSDSVKAKGEDFIYRHSKD